MWYLHFSDICIGHVFISLEPGKEARQQTHTGRSESIQISIRGTGPSFFFKRRARLSQTGSLTTWVLIHGTVSSFRQSPNLFVEKVPEFQAPSAAAAACWMTELPPVTQLSVTCSDLLQRGCGDWSEEERPNACETYTNCFPDNREYKDA